MRLNSLARLIHMYYLDNFHSLIKLDKIPDTIFILIKDSIADTKYIILRLIRFYLNMNEEPSSAMLLNYSKSKIKLNRVASARRSTRKQSINSQNISSLQISDSIKDLDAFKSNTKEIIEILEIAQKEEEKTIDVFSQIKEMQETTFKYNSLKKHSVVNWIKSRYGNVAKKEYSNTDAELLRHKEIEDMFFLFDKNRSGTLEINELTDMFKSNGISLKK